MHFCNTRKHIETTYSKCLVQLGTYTTHLRVCTSPSSPRHSIFPLSEFWLAYFSAEKLSALPLSKQSMIQLSTTLFPSKSLAKQSLEHYKASPKSPGIKQNTYLTGTYSSFLLPLLVKKGHFYPKITVYYFKTKLSYSNHSGCQQKQEILGFFMLLSSYLRFLQSLCFPKLLLEVFFPPSTPLVIFLEVSHSYLFQFSSHSKAEDSTHTASVRQMLLKRNTKYKLLSTQLHGLNWQYQLRKCQDCSTEGQALTYLKKSWG